MACLSGVQRAYQKKLLDVGKFFSSGLNWPILVLKVSRNQMQARLSTAK